jgi:hypothetical protein
LTQTANRRYDAVVGKALSRSPLTAAGAILLLAVLTGVGPAQGLFSDDENPYATNEVRLRVEFYSLNSSIVHGSSPWDNGLSSYDNWGGGSTLRADLMWNRFRIGLSASENITGWFASSYLPVHVGYTIWQRPIGVIWRNEGMVPEVRAEFTAYYWNTGSDVWDRVPFAGRADVIAGADMLGVGVEIAAGIIGIDRKDDFIGQGDWHEHTGFSPNIELRLRFGTYLLNLSSNDQL